MKRFGRVSCGVAAIAIAAFGAAELTYGSEGAPAQAPPAQVTAVLVSGIWNDISHVYWSIVVKWQEGGGLAAPAHTDYVRFRAPWGGTLSIDDCVRESTNATLAVYQSSFLGWQPAARPDSWSVRRAWWWHGDPGLEPILRIPALGQAEPW